LQAPGSVPEAMRFSLRNRYAQISTPLWVLLANEKGLKNRLSVNATFPPVKRLRSHAARRIAFRRENPEILEGERILQHPGGNHVSYAALRYMFLDHPQSRRDPQGSYQFRWGGSPFQRKFRNYPEVRAYRFVEPHHRS